MNSSGIKGWVTAARPKTLPAALGPILPGAALAWSEDSFKLLPVIAALAAALLLQIAVNIANDYFDFIHGIDTPDRVGPTRAAAGGLLSLKSMRIGMALITLVILTIGVYLIYIAGLPILIIGLASVISVYLYSAGPFPLSSNALGDLFVFTFFGPAAVCGTYYVQTLNLNIEIILYSISIGLLITAILVVNNYRDIKTDTAGGKKTLAVVMGEKLTRVEYYLLVVVAYLIPPTLVFLTDTSPWVLLSLVSAPLWVPLFQDMYGRTSGKALNKTLAGTAKAGLLFSVLLSFGILLSN
ncbi:MAG: 1,4-dihydroxy-2-naphthoate polyprenyltransferase [Spirochaetia bacterium]|jgi:1,4-dihydroxy-2-naphthoate octaprenyltransferase|nr:1,4-dihydroxy-2-naphthoate polyprenyltransferase [Spirochaetia bacterium]